MCNVHKRYFVAIKAYITVLLNKYETTENSRMQKISLVPDPRMLTVFGNNQSKNM